MKTNYRFISIAALPWYTYTIALAIVCYARIDCLQIELIITWKSMRETNSLNNRSISDHRTFRYRSHRFIQVLYKLPFYSFGLLFNWNQQDERESKLKLLSKGWIRHYLIFLCCQEWWMRTWKITVYIYIQRSYIVIVHITGNNTKLLIDLIIYIYLYLLIALCILMFSQLTHVQL